MLNSINVTPSFTANRARRTPETINIVGPTKSYPNSRIDVKFDDTTVSFPKSTTLEDLLKSIDRMMNTYLGKGKSNPEPTKAIIAKRMYG